MSFESVKFGSFHSKSTPFLLI